MTDSILEEIERGWRLLNVGKEAAALKLMIESEKKENLTPEERLRCQILKGWIVFLLGRFDEALVISKQILQESINLKLPLLTIEATFIKWEALFLIERAFEAWEDVKYCEELIKSPLLGSDSEIEQAEALFMYMRGYYHYWVGEYDQALQYHEKSLEIVNKHNRFRFLRAHILMIVGHSYGEKGELDKAFEHHKKSLECTVGNGAINMIVNAVSFNSMGTIYYQKGDLDQAIEHFEKSLQIFEKFNVTIYMGIVYDNLVKASLDRKDLEKAQEYLHRFSQYNKNVGGRGTYAFYELSRARILKSSTRTRDWTEAERILKDLIREPKSHKGPQHFTSGLITLCNFYFQELTLTNDLEILEDIQPLIARLLDIAEKSHLYSTLCETYLVQAKLSLLTFNIKKTKRFLTQAHQIAERFGLNLLAKKIAKENEDLLKKLDLWEKLKESGAPVADRLKLARLEEKIVGIVYNSAVLNSYVTEEKVVISKEKKICLICRGEVLRFSYICECGANYCETCARALADLENVCWACETQIDTSKPVKPYKEEEERGKIGEKSKKK